MRYCKRRRHTRQIELLRAQFAQGDGLAFAEVLPADRIERALTEEGATWREIVFTPLLTLWAFLSQVVSADSSCRAAVARVLAWLVSRGERPCSPKTDPYCKARRRLPHSLFTRLVRETGATLHSQVTDAWLWRGRRVKLVDGSTVSMPDTAANQDAYPQHPSQQAGIGFPIARLVAVFCLACGTVLDAALGKYQGKQTARTPCCGRWTRPSPRGMSSWQTAISAAISTSPSGSSVASIVWCACVRGGCVTCAEAAAWDPTTT